MRYLLLFTIALTLNLGVSAQGINFSEITFNEAIEKAKQENKNIFVDCYTTWCGPCKRMAKQVFPLKEVGDYFNSRYICLKVDVETEKGALLAKKFKVNAYPTLLFLDSNGKELHRKVGGLSAAELIKNARISQNPNMRIESLDKKYADGNREPEFIDKYVSILQSQMSMDKMRKVANDYLNTLPNEKLLLQINFKIYESILDTVGSNRFSYILNNKNKFEESIGKEKINYFIKNGYIKHLQKKAVNVSTNELSDVINECKCYFAADEVELLREQLLVTNYIYTKQYKKWKVLIDKTISELKTVNKREALTFLHSIIMGISTHPTFSKNAELNKMMIGYSKEIENIDPKSLAGYYCLAIVYKNLNDKNKALANINTFIQKGRESGHEPEEMTIALKREIEKI